MLVDIDLSRSKSGFDIFKFESELENFFKKDFEITTERALHPLIRKQILKEIQLL